MTKVDITWETYRITGPFPLPQLMAERDLETGDVWALPKNWKQLDWYKAVQDPCIIGDDVFIAVDYNAKRVYAIFDAVCDDYYRFNADKTLEEMLIMAAIWGDEDDITPPGVPVYR